MSMGLVFWILMLLWLVFGMWSNWPADVGGKALRPIGGTLMLFLLMGLLGWQVFGPPIHG